MTTPQTSVIGNFTATYSVTKEYRVIEKDGRDLKPL